MGEDLDAVGVATLYYYRGKCKDTRVCGEAVVSWCACNGDKVH